MKSTVLWKPQAERTLLKLWLESSHRVVLTKAAEEIESLVRQRPESIGESRELGRRWLFVEPLGVRGTEEDYADRHPGPADLPLVIEVADSSLGTDRSTKPRLYATAGVT